MKILALDPARDIGWAYRNEYGEISVDSCSMSADPLIQMCQFDELLQTHEPDLIAYEDNAQARGGQSAGRNVNNIRAAGRFEGVLMRHAYAPKRYQKTKPIQLMRFTPPEWRKKAYGNGNASKDHAVMMARTEGFPNLDHNAAEALGILWAAMASGGIR